MKKIVALMLLYSTLVFSQQEASVWYFGENAGLKFNDNNTVTPLSDGLLNTEEGCSSIADVNGNLLFYTDGRTVWDRNHIKMPNADYVAGTGMFGDPSSTQSAIIVPKPNDPNVYYIFTVDEPQHENAAVYPNAFSGSYSAPGDGVTPTDDDGLNNGFNYSIVDLSVMGSNGSIGDVISRNNHLITYDPNPLGEEIKYKCSEKITAIKNEATNEYWVVTHFINRFFSFKVTATGVVPTPIVSTIGPSITMSGYRRNAQGYLKASPSGEKIAIAHAQNGTVLGQALFQNGQIILYDIDKNTGVVSDQIILIENIQAYGVEFSPQSTKVYATYRDGPVPNMTLAQFDLNSGNIPTSKVIVFNTFNYLLALQLAPNNKIYCATSYENALGVINNPDLAGLACNYINNGQALATNKVVKLGLPPFITSFFNVSFLAQKLCFGEITEFILNSNETITSVTWDFGDGFTASIQNPTHQYAAPGTYTVTVTATTATQTTTKSRTVTISSVPVIATAIPNQTVCGTNGMSYDLTQFNSSLLGSQSAADFGVAYFSSLPNATAHSNLLNTNFILPIGTTTFFAKVYSIANASCNTITSFTVNLFQQPIANVVNSVFVCDDVSNDGAGIFNLNDQNTTILGSQNTSNFTISYHLNQADSDNDSNALSFSYQNITNPQTIFVRIENNLNTACFDTTSFQIGVNALPFANALPDVYVCDDVSNDGIENFNLELQSPLVLGTQLPSEFSVSYHLTQTEADSDVNALPSAFQNTTNPQTIFVRIENVMNGFCFVTTQFDLNVLPKPNLTMNTSYTICEGVPITIEAPIGFSSYAWSTGSVTNATTINLAGSYTLTVTQNYGTESCSDTQSIIVLNSNVATITQIETIDWTDIENSITVIVTGDGVYEYSLDGISYQDDRTFNGLLSGEYTIFVRDKRGCGIAYENFFLLMYPKFFTPNNDGINDTWLIKNSYVEPNMQLFIYNRYGKLLKQFSSLGQGWDGTLSGSLLPADDYWFVVKRENGKEFRGHFAMKR